jgi:serine/threonine-protein kinase
VKPGTLIEGKYRVESVLARGGMGVVVAARHMQLDELVALKFLSVPDGDDKVFRERFLREARVTAKLRGRHVVRLMDFGVDEEERPFLVMELLEGETLRNKLAREGPLPVSVVIDYGIQVCHGLAEAHHMGVVHRDLKPANLFVTKDVDGSDLVKIVDFGLSKLRDMVGEPLTVEGTLLGSPKYMAPEQVASAEDVDSRADIWSLGAILYELLAGVPPFRATSTAKLILQVAEGRGIPPLSHQNPQVGLDLEAVIMRCLTKELDQRTPDVGELAVELAAAFPRKQLLGAARAVVETLDLSDSGRGALSVSRLRKRKVPSSSPRCSSRVSWLLIVLVMVLGAGMILWGVSRTSAELAAGDPPDQNVRQVGNAVASASPGVSPRASTVVEADAQVSVPSFRLPTTVAPSSEPHDPTPSFPDPLSGRH